MKKRKNIIISVVTCMVSICLMMFGVYAATNPSVSINGQVSYTVTDAKLLVQGKLTGAKGVENGTYPEAASTYTSSTRVVDKNNQYLDFTTGGSTGNASDNLAPWSFGDLEFEEITGGYTNPISASLKMTNYSSYNVKATITMANSLENVTRTVNKAGKELAETSTRVYTIILPAYTTSGKSVEVSVVYNVTDASKSVPQQNVNFEVKFEWTNEQPTPTVSVDDIIASNGIVNMGKTRFYTEVKDYEWNVDEDGYVLNLDGTRLKTDDGNLVQLNGYLGNMWMFDKVNESGEKMMPMKLGEDQVTGRSTLMDMQGNIVIATGIDSRIYIPEKDMKWIAYAYKNASEEVKKIEYTISWVDSKRVYTLTENSIQELSNAVTVYFANYWDIPLVLYKQVYLATDKITKDSSSKLVHNDITGTTVLAGDYYYSDIRQRIRNNDSELIQAMNIDTNNAIYKNIQTRTINDLYKNNYYTGSTYTDQALPNGADGSQEDMFWVLSVSEFQMCPDSYPFGYETGTSYTWTRTLDEVYGTAMQYSNYHGGMFYNEGVAPDYTMRATGEAVTGCVLPGPRIGFELTLG